MKIAINNRQKLLKISKPEAVAITSFLMRKAACLIPERQWEEISLVICDNRLMTSVNREFMNDETPTDVLSFCLPPLPGSGDPYSGEILVNAEIALRLKKGQQKDALKELALYIAHGCDHLMDQEDSEPAERRRMRSRELRWLKEADRIGILKRFISKKKEQRTE